MRVRMIGVDGIRGGTCGMVRKRFIGEGMGDVERHCRRIKGLKRGSPRWKRVLTGGLRVLWRVKETAFANIRFEKSG